MKTPAKNHINSCSQSPGQKPDLLRVEGFDFAFDASACARCGGRCCTGESGYIFTTPTERKELAKLCQLELCEFEARYTYRVGIRTSLREKPDPQGGVACVFFDLERRCCSVYSARPSQCRSFPFWHAYSKEQLCAECIGIC